MSSQSSSAAYHGIINEAFARTFAAEWIASWNSHDLARILRHYSDDFEMFSPIIGERMREPSGVLRGKDRIAEYWGQGIAAAVPPLHFELREVFTGIGSVTIVYNSVGRALAAEVLEFDAQCRVIRGRAHYAGVV
jgi:ketosteroid isomerase-like protein